MSKYLMGVDIGTTGSKAMIIDTDGNIIGSGYREYPCIYPKLSWVEQSAELVTEKTFEACREAIKNSNISSVNIASVGFSAQRATFGLIDKDNRVIGDRFYVWQDNRAISEIEYIKSKMDAFEMYCIEGQPITPTFSFEKVIWLMNNQPDIYGKTKKIVMVPDYILYRFGAEEFLCEVANAGCSGMVDIENNKWSDKIIDTYGIHKDKLPRLIEAGIVVGKVGRIAAEKTGLKEGTILCSGSGDNQCGALGAGVVKEGNASMSLGTSGVLVVGANKPRFLEDMGLMVGKALSPGLFELEGIQLGAASSYRWIRDVLCTNEQILANEIDSNTYDLMEKHIEKSPIGANGVIFMPYLIGAGYPYWNTNAKGMFSGLTFSNTKSDLIRAVMEGITLESKDMYEKIKSSGVQINKLSIIGGATKSKLWRQMIADMFNVTVKRLKVSDSTIIGAAILAGIGVGIFKDVEEGVSKMVHYSDEIEPKQQNVSIYNEIYWQYRNLYKALSQGGVF